MKITDEMIELSKKSRLSKGFAIVDDEYIIIKDSFKESAFEKTKRLREKNVNYCGPIECREKDGVIYTLEHRAKGLLMDLLRNIDTRKINNIDEYMEVFNEYMSRLKILAAAPQEHYLKFFSDIEEMKKEYLKPDYCSYDNLFYDKEKGFCFIDVYPNKRQENLNVDQIFSILLNKRFYTSRYGSNFRAIRCIPAEYKNEYNTYMTNIIEKILVGLKEYGYSTEEVKTFLDNNRFIFKENEIISEVMIKEKIEKNNENVIS